MVSIKDRKILRQMFSHYDYVMTTAQLSKEKLPLTATTPTIGSPSVELKLILSFSVTVSSFLLRSNLLTTPEPRA